LYLHCSVFLLCILIQSQFIIHQRMPQVTVLQTTLKCIKLAPTCFGAVTQSSSRYSDWLQAGRSGDQNPVGARFSAPVQTGPGVHAASCTVGTGSLPGVKSGRGVLLTPHPLLVPWSRKSRAIPLLPLWTVRPVQSLSACKVQLYLYSPYWPYGLYSASVPVQYSYTSTPPIGRDLRGV
jgi:hypothetical protein